MSEAKLDKIWKVMSPDLIKNAKRSYSYLIDKSIGDSDEDIIKSLICMMPNRFDMPIDLYLFQFTIGSGCLPGSASYALTNVSERLCTEHYDEIKPALDFMSERKHCPEKYKTKQFLCTVALQHMLDMEPFDIMTVSDARIVQQLNKWYVKCR